jgi:hypothetical protein
MNAVIGQGDQARAVVAQFGPRAEAYLQSAVHSHGADLTALAALLAGSAAARLGRGGIRDGSVAEASAAHGVLKLDPADAHAG